MSFHQGKQVSRIKHRISLIELTNHFTPPLEEKKKIARLSRNSSIEGLSKKENNKRSQLTKMVGLAFSKRYSRRSFQSEKENQTSSGNISDASPSLTSNTSISPLSPKAPTSPKLTFKSKFFKEGKELLSSRMSEMKILEEQLQIIIDQPVGKSSKIRLYRERFKFIEKLGQGSYSQVFLVQQRSSKSIFALKIIKKNMLKDVQELKRLISELKIQLFCEHPNIIKSYGTFWDEENVYILQEYPGKESLYSLMQRKKCLQVEEVSEFIGQLCQAVYFLHSHDIIHRDLKPQNILIGPGNVVKLTDFGWSVYNPSKKLRSTFCGTPFYFSPQLLSAQSYDESVDIWTIGVMTYQMLTGDNPFGIKRFQDLKRIVNEEADFSKISHKEARDFVSKLIKKERLLRTSIRQILEHPFLHLSKE